jgi:amidase
VVRHLRSAGAIIVGRTNAPEISMRVTTDNPLYGATINPWNRDASPGGSSGGAGVAAACGFGPIHHGNDIGGSLRLPAFANGVTTLKPTQGRIATYNATAAAERGLMATLMSSQGAITRSVADLRLATQVMSGSDHRDPWWVPAPWDGPAVSGPVTVAVTQHAYGSAIDPSIAAAIDRTASILDDAGYRVVEVATPSAEQAMQGWLTTGVTELKLTLDPVVRSIGSTDLQQVFDGFYEIGTTLDLAGYRAGLSERSRLLREWSVFLDAHPIVLCPYLLQPMFGPSADLGGVDAIREIVASMVYSLAFNVLGLPAGVLTVDTALHHGATMPVGVQFVGRRFREDMVLDTMETVEQAVNASTGRVIDRLWR